MALTITIPIAHVLASSDMPSLVALKELHAALQADPSKLYEYIREG